MRLVKRIAALLLLTIVALTIIGMCLPRQITVARSIKIDATADKIFPHFNNLENTIPWSPWLHHDPDTVTTFNEIPEGVGATMKWASDHNKVGSGQMEITDSVINESIEVALDFGDMGTASANWALEPIDNATKATWSMSTDMGAGPIGPLFGVLMKKWITADYDQGLENLKALVESDSN